MPQRSDRQRYFHRFSGQPLNGDDAFEVYNELRWGSNPKESWVIEGPEDMASLGEVAEIELAENKILRWPKGLEPFLAVGIDSNYIYVVPKARNKPININPKGFKLLGKAKRTDYLSEKGKEKGYYYHKHEKPYPYLLVNKQGCIVYLPADFRGNRSYVVSEEGIIG